MSDRSWSNLLSELSVPRLAGSDAVRAVQGVVEARLRAMGYEVRRESFSATAGRVYAAALAGAGTGWVALGLAPLLVLPFPGWAVSVTGLAGLGLVAVIAAGQARGYLPTPRKPVTDVNLVAFAGRTPRWWLVAHSDSKAQGLSLRGRVIAVLLLALGLAGLAGATLWRWGGPLPPVPVVTITLTCVLGGGALSRRPLSDESPGAVDNATGIVAVLAAAERLADRDDVGVLITGAEEWGMVGARAWLSGGARTGAFVNFDGIDGRGKYNLMVHRPRGGADTGLGTEGTAEALAEQIGAALQADGHPVRAAPLPLGVFVDGGVLRSGGLAGVTLSRGDLATLGAIHTARDRIGRTDVASAVVAGQTVARVLTSYGFG